LSRQLKIWYNPGVVCPSLPGANFVFRAIFCGTSILVFSAVIASIGSELEDRHRVEHMVRAAVHLEEASLVDAAAEIRRQIQSQDMGVRLALLEKKLEELAVLQAEIDELRGSLGSVIRVRVQARLMTFQPDQLEDSGVPLVSLRHLLQQPEPTAIKDETGHLTEFVALLEQQRLLRCAAELTVLAVPEREASCHSGGPSAKSEPIFASGATGDGRPTSQMRCLATLEGEQIVLDVNLTHASLHLKTRVRLDPGQPVILGGFTQREDPGKSLGTGVLVILNADVVGSTD
jgi:hypothetical protein